ncbi:MAG: DUF4416 family protein [Synergistes sp.]|nr:DUF4416 family protein [Synergistes sp.]
MPPRNDIILHDCEGKHPCDPLVKKITGLLVPKNDPAVYENMCALLERVWGKPERISQRFPFTWTDYYRDISPELDRIFFSYPGLYPASKLPDWKTESCSIEKQTGKSRRVNIDPGAVDGAKLLLASTKGQAQRVYLRDGIFCEVTLCRRKGKWEHFSYTFPDFSSGIYDSWLETVREDWKKEIKQAEAILQFNK